MKSQLKCCEPFRNESPSTRREWIEMWHELMGEIEFTVSLHTEGVD